MVMTAALLVGVTSCESTPTGDFRSGSPSPSTVAETFAPNVVHFGGVGKIRLGDRPADIVARGLAKRYDEDSCYGDVIYEIPGYEPDIDLVFGSDERLTLIWVLTPRAYTPEKLSVASTVDQVRQAYPKAEDLNPPHASTFPAVLVADQKSGGGYLFLYEPHTKKVAKLIVAAHADLKAAYLDSALGC